MQCSRPNQVFASPTEKYSGTLELDFSHSQQRIEELPSLFKVGARSDWLPSVTTQRYFQHLRKEDQRFFVSALSSFCGVVVGLNGGESFPYLLVRSPPTGLRTLNNDRQIHAIATSEGNCFE